jgi:hypothetical protein
MCPALDASMWDTKNWKSLIRETALADNTISKITSIKKDGGIVQVIEHLASCEALSSSPNTSRKKKKKGRKEGKQLCSLFHTYMEVKVS